jgi:hypothetical protein
LLLVLAGCRVGGYSKDTPAKAFFRELASICNTYKLHNGDWPPSLDALAAPQPDGGPPLIAPAYLTDPWGHPWQYDPAGPRNGGERPDIWTVTPQGKVIGNWPGGH